ncbi:phosphoethanolamine transferase [Microbulbifer sp. ANSA002]|uniref:phosphoethanolamine transferase n=1 Tax=unclassified Microbulbifer TaxID=2619833 RepID=UPI00404190AD
MRKKSLAFAGLFALYKSDILQLMGAGLNHRKKIAVFFGVCSFLLLLLPNFLLLSNKFIDIPINFEGGEGDFLWRVLGWSHPLLPVIFIELFILSLVGRFSLWFVLNLPFFIFLPLEIAYVTRYGTPISSHILAIVMQTNLQEILGYLGGWMNVLLLTAYILFLLFLFYFFHRAKVGWFHRTRVCYSLIVITLIVLAAPVEDKPLTRDELRLTEDIFSDIRIGFGLDDYVDSFPFGLILRTYQYYQKLKVLNDSIEEVKDVDSGLSRVEYSERETYVLVIGESSRADHWSINGYERETTPRLSERSNVFSFTNAVSVASSTRASVPAILSKTSVDDLYSSRLRRSWITDLKHAGFRVYWLSTQMQVGEHDTMIGAYASLADESRYLNEGMYLTRGKFDGVTLGPFEDILRDGYSKKLIIIHTLGSHFPYHFRYPEEFKRFEIAPSIEEWVDIFDFERKEELMNSYDNSIYYTDFILDSIISSLAENGSTSFLWYISDHGQTIFEPGCNMSGHGFMSEYNFRVPVIFWGSDQFFHFHSGLREILKDNISAPLYSADFFDTMLHGTGFIGEGQLNSFLLKDYSAGQRIVTVQGDKKFNFDEVFSGAACDVN